MIRLVSALCVWLIIGAASAGPVDTILRERCQGRLADGPRALIAHVVLWPVSVLATWGLPSKC